MEQQKNLEVKIVEAKVENIKFGEKMAYLLGGWNTSMLLFVSSTYLMFFYTDIFGITAAATSMILLVGRIWDAVNDLLVGNIADNTHTKWGKVRPFFLWFAIPIGLSFMFMYQVPDLSMTGKVIYALITYLIFDTVYTCIYIPNSAILVSSTLHSGQRVSLSFFSAAGSMAANLIIPLTFWMIITAMGAGDYKIGFPKLMVVFGIIAILILLYQFFFTRERYTPVKEEKVNYIEGIKQVLQNKYVIIILIVNFFITIGQYFFTSVSAYYGKLVLDDISFPTKVFMVYSIVSLISFPVLSKISKKVSVKKLFLVCQIIGLISSFGRLIFGIESALIMLILVGVAGIQGASNYLVAVLLADSYEYGEWKFKTRVIGTATALNGFFLKLSYALAAAIVGWMLTWAEYTTESVLTDKLYTIFEVSIIYLPLILSFIGVAMFVKLFDLDKMMPQIRKEMAEKREAEQQL